MAVQVPRDFRRVIVARRWRAVIEWYDFISSATWPRSCRSSSSLNSLTRLLLCMVRFALFTAGFLIRPLGAFSSRWLRAKPGLAANTRSFLALSGMGLGTGDRIDPDLRGRSVWPRRSFSSACG